VSAPQRPERRTAGRNTGPRDQSSSSIRRQGGFVLERAASEAWDGGILIMAGGGVATAQVGDRWWWSSVSPDRADTISAVGRGVEPEKERNSRRFGERACRLVDLDQGNRVYRLSARFRGGAARSGFCNQGVEDQFGPDPASVSGEAFPKPPSRLRPGRLRSRTMRGLKIRHFWRQGIGRQAGRRVEGIGADGQIKVVILDCRRS